MNIDEDQTHPIKHSAMDQYTIEGFTMDKDIDRRLFIGLSNTYDLLVNICWSSKVNDWTKPKPQSILMHLSQTGPVWFDVFDELV